jgi:hypothetical protein
MYREVDECIMSNEITSHPLGGPGAEVEVDECYLTRRKYNVGRLTKMGTITILGLYERDTGLGFHLRGYNSALFCKQIIVIYTVLFPSKEHDGIKNQQVQNNKMDEVA